MYRPQRLIRTPPGFRDEPYVYEQFGFNTAINPLSTYGPIVVSLDQDADFYLCSLATQTVFITAVEGGVNSNIWLGIKIQDTFGRALSDDFCTFWQYAISPLTGINAQNSSSGYAPGFDDPVYCQAGGSIQYSIKNFSDTAQQSFPGPLEFRGFKRYKTCPDTVRGGLKLVSQGAAA